MNGLRRAASALALFTCCASPMVLAQTSATQAGHDLVVKSVDATQLKALPQSRMSWATAENDLGEVPPDLLLSHLTVVLRRTPEQQLAFEALLEQQQDPISPNYHHWLTPVEVGGKFGASAHDIDALT